MVEKYFDGNILGITCLKRFSGLIFAVQDANYTIRFFRLETMMDSTEETFKEKLILLEIL